tara:strand:+ start:7846 stop:8244 length:399 start_codon:yes stop_codon:yes gene_type:complete
MSLYFKKASEETPLVSFNAEKGVLVIDGNCSLEDPGGFFKEISDWISEYSKSPNNSTVLTINLAGINISNSKFLLNIIYQIDEIFKSGFDVKIRWVFNNDEDGNYELGNDYAEMVTVPFEFIETIENFVTNI